MGAKEQIIEQRNWLARQFENLTTYLEVSTPSECAERIRYLPPSNTNMPGFYRFSVAPYLREIVDCLSVDSPIREIAVMKGVQICMTTGVLENGILYGIEHVKTAPMMLVTADGNLAKGRIDSYIIPMIQSSGLNHLITSADEGNSRKTGKTEKKIEWVGGGFLMPLGAQNPNAFRSIPIRFLFRDEIDGWPIISKDGDPLELTTHRTKSYEDSRKIVDVSTPAIKGSSKIAKQFARGDQRRYHVCCLGCGHPQVLRWKHIDPETGVISGIVWDLDENGKLVRGSVRYLCIECGHPHVNEDKTRLLAPEYGAEWLPTAVPVAVNIRSYHVSALYSPVGMQTWEGCVLDWLEAWDVVNNRVKDVGKLQVFYNNILGEPFEVQGEKLKFNHVSPHRRGFYRLGEIPNLKAIEHCGSPVLFVVCTVDVQKTNLAVAVWGWAAGGRVFLINYDRYEGDSTREDDPGTWQRLAELLETKEYRADDGKNYRISLALVDSGYQTDVVYKFCSSFGTGVFAIKGQALTSGRVAKHYTESTTPMGQKTFGITVDLYKDRWSAGLKRSWDRVGHQPEYYFNAPSDIADAQLKELAVEQKDEVKNPRGEVVGYAWRRPNGVANELWDLLVYASAAHDIIARSVTEEMGFEQVDHNAMVAFYQSCEQDKIFFW